MPRTSNAFNWAVYVVVACFAAWGVWFEAIQMNLFDTTPKPIIVRPVKTAPDMMDEKQSVRLPMKPSGKLSMDEAKDCVLTRYEGYATVKAWYEESDMYGEKTNVLRVAESDRFMLPEKVRQWADGTPVESLLPDAVPAPLNTRLLKASAVKPTDVKIVELKVYCEGYPSAKLALK